MKYILLLLAGLVMWPLAAQTDQYEVTLDLVNVADDQIPVTILTPKIEEEEVEFHMAKIVPGTYSISDFGRFITDFQAFDSAGNTLDVEKIATNKWQIQNATSLRKITYKAHDTFDRFEEYDSNFIFEPGGTNIEADNKIFVINTFGFVGYLAGYKFKPFTLRVQHTSDIAGATALESVSLSDSLDVFTARDFNFLADGPLMYNVPDIATKKLANAEVIVSVYSPNKRLSADEVMDRISDLMEAQSQYLGGQLPVDRYAYLIYLMDGQPLGGMGALEHSYSSVYTLPDANADQIGQTVRDVAAHEFFHIVTPLNIHSEEIGNFDYIDPKMSKHLWLYEGCTEYAAMHVQVKYDLYDRDTFLEQVKEKIQVRDQFPTDVPFTEMSEKILESDYEPMYTNVYYKGALIGMALDLYLLKLSEGAYDLQNLMRDLAKKYGPSRSFDDDALFGEIESLTYPEIREFLDTYVSGDSPLPIPEILSWAGVSYLPFEEYQDFTLGNIGLALGENQEIVISDISDLNDFGKAMGYEEGDVLLEFQGEEISLANINAVLDNYTEGLEVGDKIKITVRREVKGEEKEVKLKAKAMQITKENRHVLRFDDNATPEQLKVREAWLSAN